MFRLSLHAGPRPGAPRGFAPGSFQGMAGSLPAQNASQDSAGGQLPSGPTKQMPQRPLNAGIDSGPVSSAVYIKEYVTSVADTLSSSLISRLSIDGFWAASLLKSISFTASESRLGADFRPAILCSLVLHKVQLL